MNPVRLFANELHLLARSAFTGVVVILVAFFCFLGTNAVEYVNDTQFHGMGRTSFTMSLGAAQYGAMSGAALFAMLTLMVLSRDRRLQSRPLIEAAYGQSGIILFRILSLFVLGLFTSVMALIVTLLSHHFSTTSPWEISPYLFSFGLILLPSILFAILIAASLNLLFDNLDMAFLSFAAIYLLGFSSPDYLLRWIQTSASVYSDFAGIEPVGRLVVWNRLVWVCLTVGGFLIAFTIHRQPGFSFIASFVRNSRYGLVPIAALITFALAAWLYANEPNLFTSDSIFQRDLPRTDHVWLQSVDCRATIQPKDHFLEMSVHYTFGKDPDSTSIEFITNAGLQVASLTVNGINAGWRRIPKTDRVQIDLPSGPFAEVAFFYHGRIRYPVPSGFPGYISEQSFYLLENSHWIFEPLTQSRGPIHISGLITAPSDLTIVTPGRLDSTSDNTSMRSWHFTAACPNLSLGVFAADYLCETFQVGPSSVEFYFSPRHESYIRNAGIVNYIRDILGFYQQQLGALPFEGMPLKIVETSVYKPGGHSSLNVVTLAEYMLNRCHISDPNTDPRFILRDLKILAHELAHQWWGGGVAIIESGAWSDEGLAEYLTYKYLTSRYPPGLTDSILRSWKASAAGRKYAWYRRDAQAFQRMRPALRQRLLQDESKSQAYNSLPLMLIEAESCLGDESLRLRIAKLFDRFKGSTLTATDFVAAIGPDIINLEGNQP